MNRLVIIYSIAFAIHCVAGAPSEPVSSLVREQRETTGLTTYDQKQTGRYNIHLNIKDVAIIALEADHLDAAVGEFGEDYYDDYDLNDFTVKPIYGIIGIDTTTAAPPILHSEPEKNELNATAASESSDEIVNTTEVVFITSSSKPIGDSALGTNKTQNVVILNQSPTSLGSGIVVTTPTPSPDSLPPKINASIASEAEKPSGEKVHIVLLPGKPEGESQRPDQIPVQIIMESKRQLAKQFAKQQFKQLQQQTNKRGASHRTRLAHGPKVTESSLTNGRSTSPQLKVQTRRHASNQQRRCAQGKCNRRRSGM